MLYKYLNFFFKEHVRDANILSQTELWVAAFLHGPSLLGEWAIACPVFVEMAHPWCMHLAYKASIIMEKDL